MNEFDYLAKAKDKMRAERYNEVITLCDKALKINSELPDAYNFRGNANYWLGKYDSAIDNFSQAIKRDRNNPQHYYDRSWAYNMKDDMEEAIIDMTKAIELEPKKPVYYCDRAEFKFYMRRYKESIADLTISINFEPEEMKYINRGNIYLEIGQYDLAIDDYTSAIEIEPESYIAYQRRGEVKMRLEQYTEAIKDFEKSIEINPKYADAYIQLGYAKIYLGKKDAMKYFNKAIKIKPCAEYYLDRINARGKMLFRENALENLSLEKDVDTDYFKRKLYNEKQAKDDIKDLNKALDLEPDNTEALEYRADRYYYLCEFEKSVDDCTDLIELEPDSREYYFSRALCEISLGKYQETIDDCLKCIKLDDKKIDTEILFLKSDAEYKLKQYDKVVEDMNISISLKESGGAYYYRGLAHYHLKHFKRAISDIKKSIELKPDVLEAYDDKLPKPLEFAIKLCSLKNKKAEELKQERPIGLAKINKEEDL